MNYLILSGRYLKKKKADEAKFNSDLCIYHGQYYLRGIAYIHIQDAEASFGWGLWVKVDESTFNRYLEIYETDGSDEEPGKGFLANTPSSYANTGNIKVNIYFGMPSDRPRLMLEPGEHRLSLEQVNGITIQRVHELNKLIK